MTAKEPAPTGAQEKEPQLAEVLEGLRSRCEMFPGSTCEPDKPDGLSRIYCVPCWAAHLIERLAAPAAAPSAEAMNYGTRLRTLARALDEPGCNVWCAPAAAQMVRDVATFLDGAGAPAAAPEPAPSEQRCIVAVWSSRCCELGTYGCNVQHKSPSRDPQGPARDSKGDADVANPLAHAGAEVVEPAEVAARGPTLAADVPPLDGSDRPAPARDGEPHGVTQGPARGEGRYSWMSPAEAAERLRHNRDCLAEQMESTSPEWLVDRVPPDAEIRVRPFDQIAACLEALDLVAMDTAIRVLEAAAPEPAASPSPSEASFVNSEARGRFTPLRPQRFSADAMLASRVAPSGGDSGQPSDPREAVIAKLEAKKRHVCPSCDMSDLERGEAEGWNAAIYEALSLLRGDRS
jgi:hypothetical protein